MLKLTLHFPNRNYNIMFVNAISQYLRNCHHEKDISAAVSIQKILLKNTPNIVLEIDDRTNLWLQTALTEYAYEYEKKSPTVFRLSCEALYHYTYAVLHAKQEYGKENSL